MDEKIWTQFGVVPSLSKNGESQMFWLASIPAVIITGLALRILHSLPRSTLSFFALLAAVLIAFNVAIAIILVFFLNDSILLMNMMLGLIGITLGLARLIGGIRPAEMRHLANHWKILTTYSAILIVAGVIAGLAFASPAFTRDYVVKSDRWNDIETPIILVEISSLYSLVLALIMTIGSSSGEPNHKL